MSFMNKQKLMLIMFMAVSTQLWPQLPADSAAVPERTFTIGNCVVQFDRGQAVKTDAGYQYWFVDKNFIDGRTLKMSVVAPGSATHAPHQHPEDEFFFVLEGSAEFFLDGATALGRPYASFYCPPDRLHGIRNAGTDTLKYLVIKKYPAAF